MSIDIKTTKVEKLDKSDVISLFEGNISIKKANELKPLYTSRIDYILNCIFSAYKRDLSWYYTNDFTDSVTKFSEDMEITYIHKEFGKENIDTSPIIGRYSASFPVSWLYNDFEKEMENTVKTEQKNYITA